MKEALLSHREVEGVRVAVLPSINVTGQLQKIPGISKLNNFQFTDGTLMAWRAYGIGQGKSISVKNVSGQFINRDIWYITSCWSILTSFRISLS